MSKFCRILNMYIRFHWHMYIEKLWKSVENMNMLTKHRYSLFNFLGAWAIVWVLLLTLLWSLYYRLNRFINWYYTCFRPLFATWVFLQVKSILCPSIFHDHQNFISVESLSRQSVTDKQKNPFQVYNIYKFFSFRCPTVSIPTYICKGQCLLTNVASKILVPNWADSWYSWVN